MAADVAPLNGRELQRAIIEMAQQLGWRVAHFPPVPTERGWRVPVAAQGKGWPDLVLVRDRVIVAEVKGDSDRLKPEQREWLSAFRMAGIPAHVWTPESWRTGEIERILRARRQDRKVILCTCPPGSVGGRDLRGPAHAQECPLFSTGQEAAAYVPA